MGAAPTGGNTGGSTVTYCGAEEYINQEYRVARTEVYYQRKIYKNGWWANLGQTPSSASVWQFVRDCVEGDVTTTLPVDDATGVSRTPTLTWDRPVAALSNASITYTVFLERNNPPTSQLVTGLSTEECLIPSDLGYEKEYFWQVTATSGG